MDEVNSTLEGTDAILVPLQSSDGTIVTISALAVQQSGTLSDMSGDCGTLEKLIARQEQVVALEVARRDGKTTPEQLAKLEAAIPTFDSLAIPIPDIDACDLQIAVSYVERYRNRPAVEFSDIKPPEGAAQPACVGAKPPPEMDDFEKEFMQMRDITGDGVDQIRAVNARLFNILYAANYLRIQKLLDICAYTIASRLKGKTPDQIREEFGIENDFTPEELAKIQAENEWIAE